MTRNMKQYKSLLHYKGLMRTDFYPTKKVKINFSRYI